MADTYSLYEAKAKLSEIIRQVRERGRTATITYRGEPVAEIRPLPREGRGLEARLAELEATGELIPSSGGSVPALRTGERRPGALKRFLEDR